VLFKHGALFDKQAADTALKLAKRKAKELKKVAIGEDGAEKRPKKKKKVSKALAPITAE
jgi:hypothetical protein